VTAWIVPGHGPGCELSLRPRIRDRRLATGRVADEQADQVIADFIRTRILPPLGVAASWRRGGVGVRDQDDRIPAGLVDAVAASDLLPCTE